MDGIGGFLFPNIAALGDRGAPGTIRDDIVGGLKATYNLLQALAVVTNPNLAVASALGHGPQPVDIADTELAGASFVDAGTALFGGVANIGRGLAARGAGIVASNGTRVTGLTRHGINRAIGAGAGQAGTRPQAILDALMNPKRIVEGVDSQGRPFQVFHGTDARVVVNPQTGQIVSTNPLSGAGTL